MQENSDRESSYWDTVTADWNYWSNKSACGGCSGTCCTGQGNDPCTCEDAEEED